MMIKLQIIACTDDVCGQGAQRNGRHWQPGFENWCEQIFHNIVKWQNTTLLTFAMHCQYDDGGAVGEKPTEERTKRKSGWSSGRRLHNLSSTGALHHPNDVHDDGDDDDVQGDDDDVDGDDRDSGLILNQLWSGSLWDAVREHRGVKY